MTRHAEEGVKAGRVIDVVGGDHGLQEEQSEKASVWISSSVCTDKAERVGQRCGAY